MHSWIYDFNDPHEEGLHDDYWYVVINDQLYFSYCEIIKDRHFCWLDDVGDIVYSEIFKY